MQTGAERSGIASGAALQSCKAALKLEEREEISRGIAAGRSVPSDRTRSARSTAWERALRA